MSVFGRLCLFVGILAKKLPEVHQAMTGFRPIEGARIEALVAAAANGDEKAWQELRGAIEKAATKFKEPKS